MTEHIQDQLSAFIDDELSDEESAFLVRRLERDGTARGQLQRYALIGAALRGELLQPHPWVLQNRIDAALDGTPATAAPLPIVRAARQRGWRTVSRPLLGAGIAATAAIAAIGLLRYTQDEGVEGTQPSFATLGTSAPWTEPESYVVPQDNEPAALPSSLPIRLTNYLVYHGQYASHLSRTSVHSNVVGVVGSERVPAERPAVVPVVAETPQ